MPKAVPITDLYGTQITVEPLMGSIGPCVDIEFRWTEGGEQREEYNRLTPEQALELAHRLREAAGGTDGDR